LGPATKLRQHLPPVAMPALRFKALLLGWNLGLQRVAKVLCLRRCFAKVPAISTSGQTMQALSFTVITAEATGRATGRAIRGQFDLLAQRSRKHWAWWLSKGLRCPLRS